MDRRVTVRTTMWVLAGLAGVLLFLGDRGFALSAIAHIIAIAIAAMGYNLLLGTTGQVSIGHGAFMAVGAYTTAFFSIHLGVPFPLTLIPVVLFAGLLGLTIGLPALRLQGYYLAIATLAFGVVVEQLIAGSTVLGGHDGIRGIPGFIGGDRGTVIVAVVTYLIFALVTRRIVASPMGRRFRMVRDSVPAARSYGVDIARTKLTAFVLSAIYGGVAGALYAHTVGFIVSTSFGLVLSLNLLATVIIGGLATIHGGLIGAAIIFGLPFLFSRSFGPFLNIVVGALLITFVLFFPRGIAYGLALAYHRYLQRPFSAIRRNLYRRRMVNGSTVTVRNVPMHYREVGEGAPLLYLHGNTGSGLWYERVMHVPGHRCIAVDLPNFGRSGALDTADIAIYAEYLVEFIAVLNIHRPALVAHSLGGAVAHAVVSHNPDLISELIIVDGAAPDGLVTPEEHYEAIELYKTSRDLLRRGLASVTPTMHDERFLDRLTDEALLMNPIAFAGNPRALARIDYTAAVAAYRGRVLVILGERDTIITEDMARRTADAYPNGELLVLDRVGHSVMVEDPPRFIKVVCTFLRGAE